MDKRAYACLTVRTMDTSATLIEIDPIRENVSGHTNRLQINLDEDAPDREIMRALAEACKEWSANLLTGIELQRSVGRILIAVRKREIYKQEPWNTFEAFLESEIEQRFHISLRQCWNAITVAEGIPDDVPKSILRAAGAVNVLHVAQAVRDTEPRYRSRLRKTLLAKAATTPTAEFKAQLAGRNLLRTRRTERGPRLVTVSFQVSTETAEDWRKILGRRSASIVFSQWVQEHQRKPSTSETLRAMREKSA
jgi:hypothetical protein